MNGRCNHTHGAKLHMTKENFLTIRWNNVLSLGIGIPTLIYIVVAFSTSIWSGQGGLIGLSIFGALF
jgi:hypothetical protein